MPYMTIVTTGSHVEMVLILILLAKGRGDIPIPPRAAI
jgi:hypothetical protein